MPIRRNDVASSSRGSASDSNSFAPVAFVPLSIFI